MFKSDLSNIRTTRQFKTNRDLAETICHSNEIFDRDLKRLINFKSLDRLAELLGNDRDYIYEKCKADYEYALTVAHGTAILASRQGSKDESYVLDEINRVSRGYGIYVQSLNNQDLRPTKDGRLLNKEEFKKSGLDKLECLKSIDGVISPERPPRTANVVLALPQPQLLEARLLRVAARVWLREAVRMGIEHSHAHGLTCCMM